MPEEPLLQIAGEPEPRPTSESEEMYLITVARAVEEGTSEPVPVAVIARTLSVSAASVNEMIRKLANRGLVEYEPYHGVRLTDHGHSIADRVLRTRRLWATFLFSHLAFSPIEADDQACHLEHVTAADAAERLAVFLGEPEADPLGRPIPARVITPDAPSVTVGLAEMGIGQLAEVVAIEGSDRVLAFLESEGITAGASVTVLASSESGLLLQADDPVHLVRDLAAAVHVRPKGGSDGIA